MKAVMLSVRPQWCELIANGQKTVEVRKSRPKIPTPFKCYIYCTQACLLASVNGIVQHINQVDIDLTKPYVARPLNGQVIGEFVCDLIIPMKDPADGLVDVVDAKCSCLTPHEIIKYADGKMLYGWHISDLKIYDKPKELNEFRKPIMPMGLRYENDAIKRPSQSWCYVEAQDEKGEAE